MTQEGVIIVGGKEQEGRPRKTKEGGVKESAESYIKGMIKGVIKEGNEMFVDYQKE